MKSVFPADLVLPPTHDTAAAVLAAPIRDDYSLYISSGTWSLMGTELLKPICSDSSRRLNFTNEGGIEYRFRYLKNIMGLWMIQSLKRELGDQFSFPDINHLASKAAGFVSVVDVNDPGFLSPASMIQAIKDYCKDTDQPEPITPGELAECIYQSLAQSYAATLLEIERMTGRSYTTIHVIGGGCQDTYLNKLTAQTTGKQVFVGPVEATATGNILAQMMRAGELQSINEARSAVANSFSIVTAHPPAG